MPRLKWSPPDNLKEAYPGGKRISICYSGGMYWVLVDGKQFTKKHPTAELAWEASRKRVELEGKRDD